MRLVIILCDYRLIINGHRVLVFTCAVTDMVSISSARYLHGEVLLAMPNKWKKSNNSIYYHKLKKNSALWS